MGRPAAYKLRRLLDGTVHANQQVLEKPVVPKAGKVLTALEIRSRILSFMSDQDYDPIKEMINMAQECDGDGKFILDAKTRLSIHKDLAEFVAPKLKAMEMNVGGEGMTINISVRKFTPQPPGQDAKPVEQIQEAIAV